MYPNESQSLAREVTMDIDVPGRVGNTKLRHSQALLPLFEAIINAIHAVTEARTKREIRVFIERDHSQRTLQIAGELALLGPVRSFIVRDTGVGFTDPHYRSFNTSDTRQKADLGGKGIGRFQWLKAFDHAEIDSIFMDPLGMKYRRRFNFRLTEKGVEDHSSVPVVDGEYGTIVRLCDYFPDYQREVPHTSDAIARAIIEHCLGHFVLGAPAIFVHDQDADELHDLNRMFQEQVNLNTTVGDFQAGAVTTKTFTLRNLRVYPRYQPAHMLHYCAHNRTVYSQSLGGKIPNLVGVLTDESGRTFTYAGYVSGDYLDNCVNTERTDFSMDDEDSLIGPGWNTLVCNATEQVASFIAPFTESVRQSKEQRINDYVQRKAPQYRPVTKHRKDLIDQIPPNLPDDKLDVELYKASQTYDSDLYNKSSQMLSSLQTGPDDWRTFEEQYETFLEEWNEAGMAKLARHIVHRRATLDFIDATRRVSESGNYKRESAIHQIIFPLRKTSDDVRPEQMNLWILDEKLAYHYYLASDLPFNKQDISFDSKDRPDIIIFNGPIAFVNEAPPFSSVVIIEFKRPLRDDYDDEDNPIIQVYDYVRILKEGQAKDREGKLITVRSDIPIYAYIVCDLTRKLKEQAENAGLTRASDALGYFGYNVRLGVYIEVTAFDKLASDANRRNQILL